MLSGKFNDTSKQRRPKAKLLGLRVRQLFTASTTVAKVLFNVNQDIKTLFPQVPASVQVEDNRIDALKRAFLALLWASSSIERLETNGLD